MRDADKGDVVLVSGRKCRVTDRPVGDNLVRVIYPDRKTEYVLQSQVEWNYTVAEDATLDSDLHQDYNN